LIGIINKPLLLHLVGCLYYCFTSKFNLNLRKNLEKCCIWSTAFYDIEIWKPRKVDRKYLEGFKIWCWRRTEKIIWTDRVRNYVLQRVKGETDILCTLKKRKPNWTGHILRRNCLIKHVMEGKIEEKIEGTEIRGGRRHKQPLDDPRRY
jgi:hypothetical protein